MKTINVSWRDLNSETITNYYLYGQAMKPDTLVDDKWIRPGDSNDIADATITLRITDLYGFMNDSDAPGRFANGSQIPLIQNFFTSDIPAGTYTRKQLSDFTGWDYFQDIQQFDYSDGVNDRAERTYIWNSMRFALNSNATFVVMGDGTKYIQNYALTVYDDNFDFDGSFWANLANWYLDMNVDASGIGRTILLDFPDSGETDNNDYPIYVDTHGTTYRFNDFLADESRYNNTNSGTLLGIRSGVVDIIDELWNSKITQFIDPQGRAILYGSNKSESLAGYSTGTFPGDSKMEDYYQANLQKGIAIIAGEGEDILRGGAYKDYLLGGTGFDRYISGNGDIIMDSDRSGQVVFEGTLLTKGVSETECKPNGDGEYRGDGGVYKLSSGKLTFTKDGTNETLTIEKFVNGALGIILTSKDPGASCPPPIPNPEPNTPSTPNPNFPSPLVLDLNGDGVTSTFISSTSTYFDLDNDGVKQRTGWVQTTDALLALDKNTDGIINDASELFGNHTTLKNGTKAANGFEALKEYDENKDGVIDAKDNIYTTLSLWQDANSDGVTDTGELHTLSELGVASINLDYTQTTDYEEQNRIFQTSSFTTTDGTTQSINDVWFATESRDTARDTTVTLKDTISVLPDFRGAGRAGNLSAAMNENTALETAVTALLTKSTTSTYASLLGDVKNILALWTHTDNISATAARGEQYIMNHNYANPQQSGWRYRVFAYARDIAILEAFWGQNFTMNVDGKTTGDVIGTEMSNYMTNAIETLTDTVLATLLVQQLYGKEAYNVTQGQFDYSALFTKLDTTLTAGNAEDKITASNLLATLIHRDGLGILFHLDTALLSDSTFKSLLSTNGITYTINADGSISGSYAGTVEGSSGSATKASVNRKKYKSENEREAA